MERRRERRGERDEMSGTSRERETCQETRERDRCRERPLTRETADEKEARESEAHASAKGSCVSTDLKFIYQLHFSKLKIFKKTFVDCVFTFDNVESNIVN